MYLSQLRLNPAHRAARRDLADPYQMHRFLQDGSFAKHEHGGGDHRHKMAIQNGAAPAVGQIVVARYSLTDSSQGWYSES